MDKLKQFKALFPLKGEVTQEILDRANLTDPWSCIGALTLKHALGNNSLLNYDVSWMFYHGSVDNITLSSITIGTIENKDFMSITSSTQVTFILK